MRTPPHRLWDPLGANTAKQAVLESLLGRKGFDFLDAPAVFEQDAGEESDGMRLISTEAPNYKALVRTTPFFASLLRCQWHSICINLFDEFGRGAIRRHSMEKQWPFQGIS